MYGVPLVPILKRAMVAPVPLSINEQSAVL